MSRDGYRDFAGAYATSVYAYDHDTPAIDIAAIDPSLGGYYTGSRALAKLGDFIIKPAHAGWFGWSADDFLDGLAAIASLALPINEIKAIWTQLGYLATDPAKFDGVDLILNVLSVATYFPVMRPLQAVVKPVKLMFTRIKRIGNPKFITSIGSVLGDAFEQLYKTGNADRLESLVPYMLIAVEMVDNWEAIEIMVQGIESPDDLWGWIEYFNLPEDGWEGEGEPPPVALNDKAISTLYASTQVLDWLFPEAHAGVKAKRLRGKGLSVSIRKAFELLGKDANPKDFTGAVKIFTRGLKFADTIRIRKLVTNPKLLTVMVRMYRQGQKNMINFLKGRTGSRIPPPLVIVMMSYLQSEMLEGGRLDDEHIKKKIYMLYGRMLADITLGSTLVEEGSGRNKTYELNDTLPDRPTLTSGGAQGAMFQLAMTAYYTLLDKIKTIEAIRTVPVYDDIDAAKGNTLEEMKAAYERHVDIVLKEGGDELGERWVELKSLQRKSETAKYSVVWDGLQTWGRAPVVRPVGDTGEYSYWGYNRQFHKDRAAAHTERAFDGPAEVLDKDTSQNEFVEVSSDFKWWFHKFSTKQHPRIPKIKATKNVLLGRLTDTSTIKERLTHAAGRNYRGHGVEDKVLSVSFGISKREAGRRHESRKAMAEKIDYADATSLMMDEFRDRGYLDEAFDEAIAEYQAELAGN